MDNKLALALTRTGGLADPKRMSELYFERVSMLGLLQMGGMLSPWVYDGVPDDAVFHVAARIPMSRMQRGAVYNKPPFDVDELIKQIEERTES